MGGGEVGQPFKWPLESGRGSALMIYKERSLTNCVEDNPGKVPKIKSNQGPNGGQSGQIDFTMLWEEEEGGTRLAVSWGPITVDVWKANGC